MTEAEPPTQPWKGTGRWPVPFSWTVAGNLVPRQQYETLQALGRLGVTVTVNPVEHPNGAPNPEIANVTTATYEDFMLYGARPKQGGRLTGKMWQALLDRFLAEQRNPPEADLPPSGLQFYKSRSGDEAPYDTLGVSSLAGYLARIDLAIIGEGDECRGIREVAGVGVGKGYVRFWRSFVQSCTSGE